MIITKGLQNVTGYIEYRYSFHHSVMRDMSQEELELMYETKKFNSLSGLIEKMSQKTLDEIKEEYDAEKIWISSISFRGKSDDEQSSSEISLYEDNSGGHIATIISNDDITNRALLNIQKIKEIVENTLEQFPVKH